MNKYTLFISGVFLVCKCFGKGALKVPDNVNTVDFIVNFESRHRALCMGILVSKSAVLTALICVTPTIGTFKDNRPINVVVGSNYRHPRSGIRIQVTKIILPKLPMGAEEVGQRAYVMQTSFAVLLLKRKVPNVVAEVPMHPINIDFMNDEPLQLQEQCVIIGWHFFYIGTDTIYKGEKFLLQRSLRVQFVNIVKKHVFCGTLNMKFQDALEQLGFDGLIDKSSSVCIRDPDKEGQACHGMYGSPLLCRGRVVGMMTAADAQWRNCTGASNVIHLFSSKLVRDFMSCVSRLFTGETTRNWDAFKKSLFLDNEVYDYLPQIYDKLAGGSSDEY